MTVGDLLTMVIDAFVGYVSRGLILTLIIASFTMVAGLQALRVVLRAGGR